MKEVVTSIAMTICSPFVVIGMLILEPIHVARRTLTRRKVHPVGLTDSNFDTTALQYR